MTTLLQPTEIVIAGAGIMGLSIALELHARGHAVTVIDRNAAMGAASSAAAGMLASDDPHNPSALRDLSDYSLALYPAYLDRIDERSGQCIPFQTLATLQYNADGSNQRLSERSIDPRQLAASLLLAARSTLTAASLLEHTGPYAITSLSDGIALHFDTGEVLHAKALIHAEGAWATAANAVTPRKGQMLRVQLPPSLRKLHEVHRRSDVYIVPRTAGPQAGSALIGATIEDAGFDTQTHPADLARLRTLAAELLPALADEQAAPILEAWAGLRPGTPDGLPMLGALNAREFVATGHFRNGILLAPATAQVIADIIEAREPAVDLSAFAPGRFRAA